MEHEEKNCPHCERMQSGINAMSNIVDMLFPNVPDALTAVGALVGDTLWKICEEKDIDGILEVMCRQAKEEFMRQQAIENEEQAVKEAMEEAFQKAQEQMVSQENASHKTTKH